MLIPTMYLKSPMKGVGEGVELVLLESYCNVLYDHKNPLRENCKVIDEEDKLLNLLSMSFQQQQEV